MNKGDITPCDCGHDAVCVGLGTGYGTDSEGKKICYSCIGKLDREELISTGKQIGYLSFTCMIEDIRGRHEMLGTVYDSKGKYTNWPGTFSIDVHVAKRSRNNFGALRTDFWFTFEGAKYHGVNVGDNGIARVKRIKG